MFNKLKLKLYDKHGMTLVETIIGFALLAIASIMLLTGFMTSAALIKEANDYKISSERVATVIDVEDTVMKKTDEIIITAGGAQVQGQYYSYTDEETNLQYKAFVPSAIQKSTEN